MDSSDVEDAYDVRKATLIAIFDKNLDMVAWCRESWPVFLSFTKTKSIVMRI